MFPVYFRVICAILTLAALFLSLQFNNKGFEEILTFKQIERIVESDIIGSINGQVHLRGIVQASKTINSPSGAVPSVYYRYLLEEEETDSDGDTHWVTRQDYQKTVNFNLIDESGQATVLSARYSEQINWQVQESYRRVSGGYRHTEWRIEPDQEVSLIANAQVQERLSTPPNVELHFERNNQQPALITNRSMAQVQADMGGNANLYIWGGISLLALAIFFALLAAKIHRILAYLSILTFASFTLLTLSGIKMLSSDIRSGSAFVEERSSALKLERKQLAEAHHFDLDALADSSEATLNAPQWVINRLSALSINLVLLEKNFEQLNAGFPENIALALMSVDLPSSGITLSEADNYLLQRKLQNDTKTQLSQNAYWWLGGASIVCLIAAWFAIRSAKVKRLIENVTTSFSTGVTVGIAEVKGRLVLDEISMDKRSKEKQSKDKQSEEKTSDKAEGLRSPLTASHCAWYRYKVEEKRGSGKNSSWVTIQDDTRSTDFLCKDKEGSILIDADNADVITRHKKTKTSGRTRYSEWILKPSDPLYVIGQAEAHYERAELFINKGDKDDLFIISNYSEADIMLRKALVSMFVFLISFSAFFLSVITWRGMEGQFSATDYMAAGLISPLFLGVLVLILHYNDLIFLRTRAQRNWANIQVSLKKRFDLVSRQERIFSAYLKHESELQALLAEQRRLAKVAQDSPDQLPAMMQNEQKLLDKTGMVIEAYPELKADKLCTQLSESMTHLENEIAMMRSGYNDATTQYNMRIQSFPDMFLAKTFGFNRMELVGV